MKKISLFTLLGAVAINITFANPTLPVQVPFTFMNDVPEKVNLNEDIDLSFFVNKSVVFQYRYKIVSPKATTVLQNTGFLSWSGWVNQDIVEIKIPRLNWIGQYRLTIEYKTHYGNQVERFEKQFVVFQEEVKSRVHHSAPPAANSPVADNNKTENRTDLPKSDTHVTDTESKGTKNDASKQEQDIATEVSPENLEMDEKISTDYTLQIAENDVLDTAFMLKREDVPVQDAVNAITYSDIETHTPESPGRDYNRDLLDALDSGDSGLFKEALKNGAETNISTESGGSIIHLMVGKIEDKDLISQFIEGGILIDKTDNSGNTALHLSILLGRTNYALTLLKNGARKDILNNTNLSPLHLAICVNNVTLVKELIETDADVNLKGNTNYTPLHIASELNNAQATHLLLNNKANSRLKTHQKLDALDIAKVQGNEEIIKLIKRNGNYKYEAVQAHSLSLMKDSDYSESPRFEFSLPYDANLIRKRNSDRIIQWIALPFLAAGLATSTYLKLTADDYYSQYEVAETLDQARSYYDKTKLYDKYSLISVGVSAIPLYAFIHSTISKNSVTKKMKKSF